MQSLVGVLVRKKNRLCISIFKTIFFFRETKFYILSNLFSVKMKRQNWKKKYLVMYYDTRFFHSKNTRSCRKQNKYKGGVCHVSSGSGTRVEPA